MPNLEQRIAQWRQTARAAADVPPETIDELESHLRDTVEELIRSGMTEADAFQRAVEQLGALPAIAAELRKLDAPAWWPLKVAAAGGSLAALGLAVVLLVRFGAGQISFLLASHVFSVTLGYSTTFLIGALGICFVGQRCFSKFAPSRMSSLLRVTFVLGSIAAALTALGIVLGMIWAKGAWGRYWAWDALETGGFAVLVWQIGFLFVHRLASDKARGILVMSVLGNIVVSLGWFGANLFRAGAGGALNWWLLLTLTLSNAGFFFVGLAPAGWLRRRKITT